VGQRPVAVVTGSRKGLGRHLAERLIAAGYDVVGCSRGPADWSAPGYRHELVDVAEEEAVQRLFATVRALHGRLDVLVNNAGIAAMNHFLLTPGATAERLFRVNVLGTANASREGARLMRERRQGRIVNVTSVAVPLRLEGESLYGASKAAVESLTRVLAKELGPFGITVNAVGPGPIDTDLTRGIPKATLDKLVTKLAMRRLCTLDDVSNVVEFLIRPESGYLTGQVVYLGGPS
jgi:3-oxoacyl-[acyl-carrier protein] reductase